MKWKWRELRNCLGLVSASSTYFQTYRKYANAETVLPTFNQSVAGATRNFPSYWQQPAVSSIASRPAGPAVPQLKLLKCSQQRSCRTNKFQFALITWGKISQHYGTHRSWTTATRTLRKRFVAYSWKLYILRPTPPPTFYFLSMFRFILFQDILLSRNEIKMFQ